NNSDYIKCKNCLFRLQSSVDYVDALPSAARSGARALSLSPFSNPQPSNLALANNVRGDEGYYRDPRRPGQLKQLSGRQMHWNKPGAQTQYLGPTLLP